MGPDERATCREIAKFSQQDAERYPAYNRLLERVAAAIDPLLAKVAPDPLPLPSDWRKIGVAKRLRDAGRLMELYQAAHQLRSESPAKRILVERGQTVGVALWNDTFIESPIVASSIDAHQTFERLLDPAELPAEFRTAIAKIDYASASAKINLALSEPPRFTG